jgi:ring-1,2-phenylacetyl-CoA epoxidase subunit PaaA
MTTMARFDEAVEAKDFERQDPEYRDLVSRVLTIQADCEIGGPHLYLDRILPDAPSRTAQIVVARTAAEEIDHFRKIAGVAGEIGTDVSHVLRWSNQERYVEAFRTTIETWEDFAVFGFLIDRVGKYQLDEFLPCTYKPLQRVVESMHDEEESHSRDGMMETARMALKGGEQKERLQRALDHWYVTALDMFGASESRRSDRYRYWGLKRRTNEEARQEYMAEVNPLIEKMGLEVPDPVAGRKFL